MKIKSWNKSIGRFLFGFGIWDSWGLGFNYCHYSKAVTLEFIHFYVYVEYWTKQEVQDYRSEKGN